MPSQLGGLLVGLPTSFLTLGLSMKKVPRFSIPISFIAAIVGILSGAHIGSQFEDTQGIEVCKSELRNMKNELKGLESNLKSVIK